MESSGCGFWSVDQSVEEEGGGERTCMDSLRTVRVSSTQSYTILVYMVFDKAPEHVAVFVFFWL
jgi:hypothetical protein